MAKTVTAAQIRAIAGSRARADLVDAIVRGWPQAIAKAKVTNENRAWHFLANIMTETGGLQVLSESGAYRYETILKIFGAKRYSVQFGGRGHSAGVTPDEARKIAALPLAQRERVLFNRVYGVGNPSKMKEFNNTGPDDGYKYRGGGMMQATGKSNYAKMAKKTGLPLVEHPEMLHQPDTAFLAACLDWGQDNRANAAADRDDIAASRKVINGGSNGLAECKVFLAKAKKVLTNYDAAPVSSFMPADDEVDPSATEDDDSGLNVQPVLDTPSIDVEIVQKKLIKLGYYEVGIADGRLEGRTTAAIAAFKKDRGLSGPPVIDEELKASIQDNLDAGWNRPIAENRANATAADLAPTVPAVRLTLWQRFAAKITAWFAGIGVFFNGVSSWFSSFNDFMQPVKDFFTDVPGWFWFLLIGVAAAVWWYATNKTAEANVRDFNEGRRL